PDSVNGAAKDCDGIVAETHRSGIGLLARFHHRKSADPQGNPPPMASKRMRLPRLIRRSATASASASGIEAADVLPCRSTVVTTFAGSIPSLCAEPSMMRLLA